MTLFTAPYVLEYAYRRSTGPVIGRFLGSLKAGRVEGIRAPSGKVIVPPLEYDPDTGEACEEWVDVADVGVIPTWSWVAEPRKTHPLQTPFAFALIRLDGADTALLHAVDAPSPDHVKTGARVKARWAPERVGFITDIQCFELADD